MKIFAFAATNHQDSINMQLLEYATSVFKEHVNTKAEIETLNLRDYELPFYRQDREAADGIPTQAQEFYDKIGAADALIISFAEHNGGYTAVYKNLFDWMSRIDGKFYQNKPAILLSTSPGSGGAKSALGTAQNSASYFAMDVKAAVSVPSFYDNFSNGVVTDSEIATQISDAVKQLA